MGKSRCPNGRGASPPWTPPNDRGGPLGEPGDEPRQRADGPGAAGAGGAGHARAKSRRARQINDREAIAIAPQFVIWFGYQIESKIAMSRTITLLPILLNALEGIATVERDRLNLTTSVHANRWQTF